MAVTGLGHVNLRAPAAALEQLRRFYVDIVGLREGPRPTFRSGSHGHWLYAGALPVLHLTCAPAAPEPTPGKPRVQRPGFDHFAFDCSDLAATRARLDTAGIEYSVDVVAELQQVQLFLADPLGTGVELTFVAPDAMR